MWVCQGFGGGGGGVALGGGGGGGGAAPAEEKKELWEGKSLRMCSQIVFGLTDQNSNSLCRLFRLSTLLFF